VDRVSAGKVEMGSNEFLDGLAEVLEQDPASLTGEALLADLNWDSLAFVSFIAMVDTRFGVTVPPRDLVQCRTVADLAALVGSLVGAPTPR
jgi:acyl carrier protein